MCSLKVLIFLRNISFEKTVCFGIEFTNDFKSWFIIDDEVILLLLLFLFCYSCCLVLFLSNFLVFAAVCKFFWLLLLF